MIGKGLIAHLQINCEIGCGDVFVPGQLFAFGSVVLHANSTGRLDHVKSFPPNKMIMFGSLEYTAHSRGDLTLSGWALDRLEDTSAVVALTSEPNPN